MENRDSNKIKVLIVATSMRQIGGQSVQAASLMESFAGNQEIEIGFLPIDPQLRFFGFLQKVAGLRTIATSLKFWRLLLTGVPRFDIVHVFSSATTGYLISTLPPLLFAKIFRKKIILNYHSGEAEMHIKNWRWLALPTMKMFDRIAVPSQFLVNVFAKFDLNSTAIFNFIDSAKFRFRARKPLRPIFLSNRNFEKHYNVGCLLRAFQKIQSKIPEAGLMIAGSGSEETELKKLTEELGLKNSRFLGKIDPDGMPGIYDLADIYLNTSIVDNMPLSVIEAFAAGLPVISTNPGGIPHIVSDGRTGLLVEVNNYSEMAEKAISLLENPSLAEELTKNALGECAKYTAQENREKWIALYRDII